MLDDTKSLKKAFQDAYDKKLKPKWRLDRRSYREYIEVGDTTIMPDIESENETDE